jgi:hypothetical protein
VTEFHRLKNGCYKSNCKDCRRTGNGYKKRVQRKDLATGTKCCSKCGEWLPDTAEYFRCRAGKTTQPCRNCHRIANRCYQETHTEERKQYARNTRDKARLRNKRYIERYPNRYRARHREYYKKHREGKKQYGKAYRAKYPEKYLIYRERRIARKRNLPTTFTATDWQSALDYFGGCCAVCGRPKGLWHTLAQDHWIPLSKGGPYTPDNIVPLCQSQNGDTDACNNTKSNRDPIEWLNWKYGKREAAKILKRIEAYFVWVKEQE